MNPAASTPPPQILLRKYRNRRYYDTTRSLHVSLEDIYQLIVDGHDVQVTDVNSGEDITAKVLAQIILEHDPAKLGVFPAELLHRVIRANEPLIREFIDRYFNQFLRAYLESQREFDRYLRRAMGLEFPVAAAGDWFHNVMWPFGQAAAPGGPGSQAAAGAEPEPPAGEAAATAEVARLQGVIEQLQEQIQKTAPRPRRHKSAARPKKGG